MEPEVQRYGFYVKLSLVRPAGFLHVAKGTPGCKCVSLKRNAGDLRCET